MSVSVTIRDVPDEVRNELAGRASRSGQSLQEYLRTMLISTAARPSIEEVIARARTRVEAAGTMLSAEQILDDRDADRR